MASRNDKNTDETGENTPKNISISKYVFDVLRGLKTKGDYGTFDKTIRALLDKSSEEMKKEIDSVIKFLEIESGTEKL